MSPWTTARIPFTRSSGTLFFRIYPAAPACSMSSTKRFPACMESATTFAEGSSETIFRVASIPSKSGIVMSIITTFGERVRTRSTASWPSPASPTIRKSSSSSRRRRSPFLKSGWSSTSRIVVATAIPFSDCQSHQMERTGWPSSLCLARTRFSGYRPDQP